MDELIPHKDQIEIALYQREKDLFSMNLNLVFYDLTSSYFEGDCCPLAHHGYSRDRRPDLKQVVIGLLVTDEGLPIAHQVYPGNTKDSNTLNEQINLLKQRFKLKQCVLVVDRGLVSEANLSALVSEGYQYIVALRKRKRELFLPVLREKRLRLQPVSGEKDLLGFETKLPEFGEDRVVFYHNTAKAEVEARHRKERLDKAKTRLKEIQVLFLSGKRQDREKLLQQAARCLERKKLSRFFQLQTDENKGISFSLKREALEFEAELDGLFVLRSNRTDLSIAELVSAYKTLARAESAFKELKDFIELRPMFHWAEERVRAHIFICVLAYLIETCIEIRLKEKGWEMTARKALKTLSEIKLIEQEIEGLKLCTYSQPTPESRKIIHALGLKLPAEKLFAEK
jgi:transposase